MGNASEARLDAIIEEARTHLLSLRIGKALETVRLGLSLARELGLRSDEAELLGIATKCHYQRGDFSGAMATGIDAFNAAAEEDALRRSSALQTIAMALLSTQAYPESAVAFRRSAEEARAAGDETLELQALGLLACALADGGQVEESGQTFERVRIRLATLNNPVELGRLCCNYGVALRTQGNALGQRGERDRALEAYALALEMLAFAAGSPLSAASRAICASCIGDICRRLGRLEEARSRLDAAIDSLRDSDSRPVRAEALLYRGRFLAETGALDGAETDLRRALSESGQVEDLSLSVECHRALAELCERKGDAAAAREHERLALEREQRQRVSIEHTRDLLVAQWRAFEASLSG